MKRIAVMVAMIAVVTTGCLGGSGKKEATTTTTSPPQTLLPPITMPAHVWPPQAGAVNRDDAAVAQRTVLNQEDLGQNWTKLKEGRTDYAQDDMSEIIVQCGFGPQPAPLRAYAVGPMFQTSNGRNIVRSYTRVVGTQAEAAKDFQQFTPERLATCVTGSYQLQSANSNPAAYKGRVYENGTVPQPAQGQRRVSPIHPETVTNFRVIAPATEKHTTYFEYFVHGFGNFEAIVEFRSDDGFVPDTDAVNAVEGVRLRTDAGALERAKK